MCLELFLSKIQQKVYNTKVLYSISSIFRDFGQKPVSILGVSFGYVWGIIWCGFEIDMRFLRLSLEGGRELIGCTFLAARIPSTLFRPLIH